MHIKQTPKLNADLLHATCVFSVLISEPNLKKKKKHKNNAQKRTNLKSQHPHPKKNIQNVNSIK